MRLIVNADDFGRSREINRAVIRAHRAGVLTSASLMVAGQAAQQAVELARENPTLAVGLHVVVVDGPAVLPPGRIPDLVDASGHFANAPVELGLRYALSPAARCQLRTEIAAQFQRFADTGLPLSHVDGHQHMHMHPVVFDLVEPLARQFGARGIRVVRDELRVSLRHERDRVLAKLASTAIFAALAWRCRRRARDLAIPARTYGFLHSGRMNEAYVLAALRQGRDPTAEIYFHPTEGERLEASGPNPEDLSALLSAAVRSAIEARHLRLSTYAELAIDHNYVPSRAEPHAPEEAMPAAVGPVAVK